MMVLFLYGNVLGDSEFDPILILRRHNLLEHLQDPFLALHDVTLFPHLLKRRGFPYCTAGRYWRSQFKYSSLFTLNRRGNNSTFIDFCQKLYTKFASTCVINLFKFSYVSVLLHSTQHIACKSGRWDYNAFFLSSCFVIVQSRE